MRQHEHDNGDNERREVEQPGHMATDDTITLTPLLLMTPCLIANWEILPLANIVALREKDIL